MAKKKAKKVENAEIVQSSDQATEIVENSDSISSSSSVENKDVQNANLADLFGAAKESFSFFDSIDVETSNANVETIENSSEVEEELGEELIASDDVVADEEFEADIEISAAGNEEELVAEDAIAEEEIVMDQEASDELPPLEENAVYFDEAISAESSEGSSDEAFADETLEDALADESTAITEPVADLSDTELAGFESASIEEVEFVEDERLESILESILFASDRPTSLASIKQIFQGTNISTKMIKRALENLMVEYAGGRRGVTLEEVPGGYQLRTKIDNLEFLKRSVKTRPFKVSGPAMEVLSIVAYKQPVVKYEVDEIRGVESGHLLRALMEKNLVAFAGKSDLPGKPMLYQTTKKFLEIFSLRNLNELPTLSQIDELLPEGINEEEANKPKLADVTDAMASQVGTAYSENEGELLKITDQLQSISTSSEFFENEKIRQKEKKDAEKAQNIREALAVGEEVPTRDVNWLKKYEEALALAAQGVAANTNLNANGEATNIEALNAENQDSTVAETPTSEMLSDETSVSNEQWNQQASHDESEELEKAFEMLESGEFEDTDSESNSDSDYDLDGDPNDIADIET